MKRKSKALVAVFSLSMFLSLSLVAAGAQVYKWKDLEGAVNYSDNPYTTKVAPKAEKMNFRLPVATHEEIMGEETPAPVETASLTEEAKRQDEVTKTGVEVVDFQVTTSASGRAMIKALVKNNMPYPAAGLRVDVVLYTVDRKRLPDIEMRYTEGKARRDWLAPGDTADLSYETDVSVDEISGHNYQVVYASIAKVQPGSGGEGVREVLLDKQTGMTKEVKKTPPPTPETKKDAN